MFDAKIHILICKLDNLDFNMYVYIVGAALTEHPGTGPSPGSGLLRQGRAGLLLWLDNDVCGPSLNCPRPPIAASREGRRHSLFGRAASPPCWPLYPSAPRGSPCGRAVTLEAAAAHFAAAPSKATALPSWLPAMARYAKITLSQVCDNHYF